MSLVLWQSTPLGRLYLGDAFEFLAQIPDESIDLVLTDPPYESLRRWEGVGTTARMGLGRKGTQADDPNKFFPTIPNVRLIDLLHEVYRILRPNRHAFVMSDGPTLPYLFNALGLGFDCSDACIYRHDLEPPPFSYWKLLVWDRQVNGMGYHFRSRHEYILMLDKGKNRRPKDLTIPDVLAFKPDQKEYPTQKPVALFRLLIEQFTEEGELVVDPFVGSGTTAAAATELSRRFLVCDIERRAIEMTARRLQQLSLGSVE